MKKLTYYLIFLLAILTAGSTIARSEKEIQSISLPMNVLWAKLILLPI